MILLTGAAGKTGKAVLRRLAEKGQSVRALVFRDEQVRSMEMLGAEEIVVGDMRDTDCLRRILQGVDVVYHICPNVHPDEVLIGRLLIDLAVSAGVAYFVYHSVLHPHIQEMPHHWNKMRVEEMLICSGLPFTILQPAVYMQNILAQWDDIVRTGRYRVPYSVDTRLSMVDLEEVAQVAELVLREAVHQRGRSPHDGATYQLVGTPALSQIEVAEILSAQLARPVVAESMSLDAWECKARSSGLGDFQVNTLLKMFAYYDKYDFVGSSQVLNWLLKRPPTSFALFIAREAIGRLHFTLRR